MEKKEHNFIENQFKAAGLTEAFTPALVAQLNEGVPFIKHPFNKTYDADEVGSYLHIKKSSNSDNYFLNKMDMDVKKEGQEQRIKQTFYLTDRQPKNEQGNGEEKEKQSQKYTFKKAYNLTAGRPVYDHISESWHKMNHANVLSNGNYQINHYSKNYGFNLDEVLAKYSIKDEYKQSLKESLERGNLQKATFTNKDGKEESLYVSPNITAGSLYVFDLNKKELPTEKLIQEGLIDKILGERLIQYVSEKRTGELKPDAPRINGEVSKPTIKDEVKQNQKQQQKPEKPQQKKKQKIK
jgi:hypothetical protein